MILDLMKASAGSQGVDWKIVGKEPLPHIPRSDFSHDHPCGLGGCDKKNPPERLSWRVPLHVPYWAKKATADRL